MALKYIIGNFLNGDFGVIKTEIPVIKGSDSVTKDFSAQETLSIDVSKLDLPNNDLNTYFEPGQKVIALIDEDAAWNAANSVLWCGVVYEFSPTVKDVIKVKALGLRSWLENRIISTITTGTSSNPKAAVSFKRASSREAIIEVFRHASSLSVGNLRATSMIQNLPTTGSGELGISVKNSDAMTYSQAIDEIVESSAKGNEFSVFPLWTTSAKRYIKFNIDVMNDSVAYLNNSTTINIDLSDSETFNLTSYSESKSINGYANRLLAQSKAGKDESGADFTVLNSSQSSQKVAYDSFFNPGVELTPAQMSDQLNARINFMKENQADANIEVRAKSESDKKVWFSRVGAYLNITGGSNKFTAGLGLRMRLAEVTINASNNVITLRIIPVLPRYPKLPKDKTKKYNSGGSKTYNYNYKNNPVIPRIPEGTNWTPPPVFVDGSGTDVTVPPFTYPPEKQEESLVISASYVQNGNISQSDPILFPSLKTIREVNGVFYGLQWSGAVIEKISGNVSEEKVEDIPSSRYSILSNSKRDLNILYCPKVDAKNAVTATSSPWKIAGTLPWETYKSLIGARLDIQDDMTLGSYGIDPKKLNFPNGTPTGIPCLINTTLDFSLSVSDKNLYINILSCINRHTPITQNDSTNRTLMKVDIDSLCIFASLNEDGTIDSFNFKDYKPFVEEFDEDEIDDSTDLQVESYHYFFPNNTYYKEGLVGTQKSQSIAGNFYAAGIFKLPKYKLSDEEGEENIGLIDVGQYSPHYALNYYWRGIWGFVVDKNGEVLLNSDDFGVGKDDIIIPAFKSSTRKKEAASLATNSFVRNRVVDKYTLASNYDDLNELFTVGYSSTMRNLSEKYVTDFSQLDSLTFNELDIYKSEPTYLRGGTSSPTMPTYVNTLATSIQGSTTSSANNSFWESSQTCCVVNTDYMVTLEINGVNWTPLEWNNTGRIIRSKIGFGDSVVSNISIPLDNNTSPRSFKNYQSRNLINAYSFTSRALNNSSEPYTRCMMVKTFAYDVRSGKTISTWGDFDRFAVTEPQVQELVGASGAYGFDSFYYFDETTEEIILLNTGATPYNGTCLQTIKYKLDMNRFAL